MTNEEFRQKALELAGERAKGLYLCCTVQVKKSREGILKSDYGVYLAKTCNTMTYECETPEEALRVFSEQLEKVQ
jgi:hypothetical protein